MASSAGTGTGTGDSRWGPRSGEPGSAFHGISNVRGGGRGGRGGRGGAPRGGYGHGSRGGGGAGGAAAAGRNGTPPARHTPLAAIATADAGTPNAHRKGPGSPRPGASRRLSLRAGAGAGAVPASSSPLVPSASLSSTSGSGSGHSNSKPDGANKKDAPLAKADPSAHATTDPATKNSSRRKRSGVGKPKNTITTSSSVSSSSNKAGTSPSALRHGSSPLAAREKEKKADDDGVPSLLKRMNMDAPPAPAPSIPTRERDRDRERQRRGSKAPAPPPIKVNKDLPPHLAARGVPHTAPLFPLSSSSAAATAAPPPATAALRPDIAALVEHMRASAMTDGSGGSMNGDHHTNSHHIDWAGDDDDSLPDLDDWGVSREKLHLEPVEPVGAGDRVAEEAQTPEGEDEDEGELEGTDEEPEMEEHAQEHNGLISPLLTMSGLRALPDVHADDANNNAIAVNVEIEADDATTPATPRAGSDSISSLSTAASGSTAPTTASSTTSSAHASSASVSASSSTPQSQFQSQSWRMPLHPSLPAKPVVAPPPVVQLPMAATPMRTKEQVQHQEKQSVTTGREEIGKVDDGVQQEEEGPGGEEEFVIEVATEGITATVSLPAPPALAPFLSTALSATAETGSSANLPMVVVEGAGQSRSASTSVNPSPSPRPRGLAASIHAPKEMQSTHSAPAHISTWADAMDELDREAAEATQPEDVQADADAEPEKPVQGVMASMHAYTPAPGSPSLTSSTGGGGGRGRPREHHRERSSRARGRHNANSNSNSNTLHPRTDGGRWSSLSHNDTRSGAGVPPHMRGGGESGGLSPGQNNTHARTHSTPPPGSGSHMSGAGPRWGGSHGPKHGHGGGGGSGGSGGHSGWNSGGGGGGSAYNGTYNMHDRYGKPDSGHGHVKRPVITGAAITQLARTIGKGGAGGGGVPSTTGISGGAAATKGKSSSNGE